MFEDDFLNNLPNEVALAARRLIQTFRKRDADAIRNKSVEQNYDNYLKAYAVIKAFSDSNNLELSSAFLSPVDEQQNINTVRESFDKFSLIATALETEHFKDQFTIKFGTGFYEFTEGDLERIQSLINELRDLISESTDFDDDHRHRLLKRLENLQSELHKKVSDLSRFWGLVGEAGVVIGKFGEDAKPIVDRISEIAGIVWRTQARAEELPSGMEHFLLSEGDKEE